MQVNKDCEQYIISVDDFYINPEKARELALTTPKNYNKQFYKGKRSHEINLPKDVMDKLEVLVGHPITAMRSYFHVCGPKDQLVYHSDGPCGKWAGIIYLTPDAPVTSGTSFWKHKDGKIKSCKETEIKSVMEKEGLTRGEIFETVNKSLLDREKWDLVDSVGNVFNRLLMWNGQYFHSASHYFGDDDDDNSKRLFQLFFFT